MDNELALSILKLALNEKNESSYQPKLPGSKMLGKEVIVRTYSAGCWFGVLSEKDGDEVILTRARRMWRWHAAEGISLSACAIHGINEGRSKIVEAVESVWMQAIEIILCTATASRSIRGAKNVEAQ